MFYEIISLHCILFLILIFFKQFGFASALLKIDSYFIVYAYFY